MKRINPNEFVAEMTEWVEHPDRGQDMIAKLRPLEEWQIAIMALTYNTVAHLNELIEEIEELKDER